MLGLKKFPCPLSALLAIIADGRNRTDDLLITSQLLYQLSYIGRGLNWQNYSQGTIVSRTSRFEVLPYRDSARFEVLVAGGFRKKRSIAAVRRYWRSGVRREPPRGIAALVAGR